ncbi:MarR family transcriptional regulator [Paenibacillus sinopodophylli]|uniref:MarR family transcriptional regulator n=1 Tax=Paenibacillus sinopodophylli TaxID=1837342 RepID=UPI00110CF7D2|nr:MarR family transcriptional regulator [Paenibacillus sinopodophylli]
MNEKHIHKQLLYNHFLQFVHAIERFADTEIDIFLDFVMSEAIETFPRHMTSVHVIDCIGKNEPINSTSIAERMNLSKASITKIGSKLLLDGLVKRKRQNENKKEIYFVLTEKGRAIFELHLQIHRIEEEKFHHFLEAYHSEELQVISRFLKDLSGSLEERIVEKEDKE